MCGLLYTGEILMIKIPERKIRDESEFVAIAKAINEYSVDLLAFPSMTVPEQNTILIEFGKDANTLAKALWEWIHRNDKIEGN